MLRHVSNHRFSRTVQLLEVKHFRKSLQDGGFRQSNPVFMPGTSATQKLAVHTFTQEGGGKVLDLCPFCVPVLHANMD